MTTTAPKAKAGFNEFFVCGACGRAFSDRAATQPLEVGNESAELAKFVPPSDAQIALIPVLKGATKPVVIEGVGVYGSYEWALAPFLDVKGQPAMAVVPARDPEPCCSLNTSLCDSRYVRLRHQLDGSFEIVGAKHLETAISRDPVAASATSTPAT